MAGGAARHVVTQRLDSQPWDGFSSAGFYAAAAVRAAAGHRSPDSQGAC